ncbi:uncharacterized protein LOC111395562 [Olea europaea var. sylvestris]|uniref:Coatomer subunit gamma n=2 Tax=Olea europaea subsp. europaea TaxID=158383 RepID=A0A8S0PHX0_OLEEU|nr:uncharacterized protein LOC111395562 [Olea europaea var. sylvestris]CAA2953449.1 coatomer subunit gamma [Olea europaea subsp. europaea]
MRSSLFFLGFLFLSMTWVFQFQAHAAPAGPLIKHLSSLLKWTRSSSKAPQQADGNVLQFEDGYLVETVVQGNELGVIPYTIRVSQDGELFAVDAENSNVVRITPPLSQYSRARLVAGSFQGHTGHVDGKPSDARFNHPKGVTMDDKGNVYVADTSNLAIRKIGEAGVTTIAGGKSNVVGYRDGPSEDAKFSSDFDVIYVKATCSLLVIDRGNAALRQISLDKEDCNYQYSSTSATDLLVVAGAILIGYATCMLQQGFGSSFFSKMQGQNGYVLPEQPVSKEKPTPIAVAVKDEQEAGWPSFGQLVWDLSKFAMEAVGGIFLQFIPLRFRGKSSKGGLTPLKDSLVMHEDESEPSLSQKQRTPTPLSETRQTLEPSSADRFTEVKLPKIRSSSFKDPHEPSSADRFTEVKQHKIRSSSFKDPSLSSKHRSSRRQEYAEFYGSGEVPPYGQVRPKSQKERTKHRVREKNGDANFVASSVEPKPVETRAANYESTNYDAYNFRSKYGDSYRYD